MGMYTGLLLDCRLKQDTPESVLAILDYMLDRDRPKPQLDGHQLFNTQRWYWMFRGSSAYLDNDFAPDSRREVLHLRVRFNIKNSTSEIENFLDWISPYVGSILEGAYQYEEMDGPIPVELRGEALAIDREHQNANIPF